LLANKKITKKLWSLGAFLKYPQTNQMNSITTINTWDRRMIPLMDKQLNEKVHYGHQKNNEFQHRFLSGFLKKSTNKKIDYILLLKDYYIDIRNLNSCTKYLKVWYYSDGTIKRSNPLVSYQIK